MLELLGPDFGEAGFLKFLEKTTDHLAAGVARHSVKKSNNLMEADTKGFPL